MAERIFSRPRALRSAGAALLALALGGCADQARHREVELQELVGMFAGQYDNIAQVRQLNAQGNGEREALVMLIVPVHAPLIGDNVFLVQESAANDPRRLISQQWRGARREQPFWGCDRGATKPAGLFPDNPPGGSAFVFRLR